MVPTEIEGPWGSFEFKMVTPADHTRILAHLRECFYQPAFYRLGYTKDMDDEMEDIFRGVLNDGHNLSFFAEDKKSGKIAACRIITLESKTASKNGPILKNRITKGILAFYNAQMKECDIFAKYRVDTYPHMFGVSVDPEFGQQGLAIEIYKRAIALLQGKGYKVALVAFISPYSRAAAKRYGFVQLAKIFLSDITDEDGKVLYEDADPEDFNDMGVFEIGVN